MMLKINHKNILFISILVIISIISYWEALKGNFLSDDYVHIYFMQKMDNDITILLKNFYSNWLDIPTTAFYRPLISVTLYIDHLIWGWNPFGYHLTNVLFHTLNGILIFLIALNFNKDFNGNPVIIFLVSVLFVVHPLHPESVYWIIGRVDSQATFFYLLSLLMFILFQKHTSLNYYIASILSFIAALASKEPAITLPAILFSYIFYEAFIKSKKAFFSSIFISFTKTKVFWLLIALYFILRFYALGTFGGGYSGTSTDFFSLEYLNRWRGLLYLFIPINEELYGSSFIVKIVFSVLWIGILLLVLIRKYERNYSSLIFFWTVTFIVTLIPIATVFNVYNNLEASRFLYLPSAIFLTFMAVLLNETYFHIKKKYQLLLIFFLGFLLLISFYQLKQNLVPWVKASNEMKNFKEAIGKLVLEREKVGGDTKSIVIVGIPDSINGAQFLRNGYGGLFSEAIFGKTINNILPILDHDFYGVKSVEVKNLLQNKESNLFGVYRYYERKGFIKITDTENIAKPFRQVENISASLHSYHHLEIKKEKYYVIGEQPWIKYKLSEQYFGNNILYLRLILKYNKIDELSNVLRVYWSDKIDDFSESKALNSQFLSCKDNQCEYIFPISTSLQWDKLENDLYFMISMPKNAKNGFIIKNLDFETTNEQKTKELAGNKLKSFDFTSFENVFYNKKLNSVSVTAKNKNEYIKFPKIDINPIATDFLSFDIKITDLKNIQEKNAKLYWIGSCQNQISEQKSIKINLNNDGLFHTYTIPLKHMPLWWTIGEIKQLYFVPFYGEGKIEIRKIVIGEKLLIPHIEFREKNTGDLSLIAGTGSVFKRTKASENVMINYKLKDDKSNFVLLISDKPPMISNLLSDKDDYLAEYLIDENNSQLLIDTTNFKKGMYFLRLVKKEKLANSITSDTIALLID